MINVVERQIAKRAIRRKVDTDGIVERKMPALRCESAKRCHVLSGVWKAAGVGFGRLSVVRKAAERSGEILQVLRDGSLKHAGSTIGQAAGKVVPHTEPLATIA